MFTSAFPFTPEDLVQLAALARLQADTLAEEGQREASSAPSRLAERLESAAHYAARRGLDRLHLG